MATPEWHEHADRMRDEVEFNGAALDPRPNPNGAMAQEPVSMDYKTGQLRDMAEQEGVADVFPDEANFCLAAIDSLIEENAYTQEEGDNLLLEYVKRYML